MFRKVLSIILSLIITISLFSGLDISSFAEENDILNQLIYEIVDDEVIITSCYDSISGDIVIPDTIEGYPVTEIADAAFLDCCELETVLIPKTVKTIAAYAFSGCTGITAFVVDESNRYYSTDEYGVLFNTKNKSLMCYPAANSRTEYSIPSHIKVVEEGAFSWCNNLETIVIPASVVDMLSSLSYCENLKAIVVDENNTEYSSADGVLYDKNKWELICYPANRAGKEFAIPETVYDLGYHSFYNCQNLESIIIPESVSYLNGYGRFSACEKLKKITILHPFCTIYSLGYYPVICGYPGSTAQEYAEKYNSEFVSLCNHSYRLIDKKTTCTENGYTTFSCPVCGSFEGNYEQATGHSDNNSDDYCDVCRYRMYYYINTDASTIIQVANGSRNEVYVKYIPEKSGVFRFSSVYSSEDSDVYIKGMLYDSQMNRLVGSSEYYDEFNFVIEYKLTAGETYYFACEYYGDSASVAFYVTLKEREPLDCLYYEIVDNEAVITGCDTFSVGNIEIPDTIEGYPVTTVADGSFWGCSFVESIFFPANVRSIGKYYQGEHYGLGDCYTLSAFTVDECNEYYSSDEYGVLFNKDKTELIRYPEGNERTEYKIPDSVTIIGEHAFFQCVNLENIIMPDSVKTICRYSFSNIGSRGKLKTLILGKNVETIGEYAFKYCQSLETIVLSEKLTEIGDYAFSDCLSLKNITIPASVSKIGHEAFLWCDSIESFSVDENSEYYSNDAYGALFNKNKTEFYYYPLAADYLEYNIPDGVEFIYYSAFYDDPNFEGHTIKLEKISIPDSVKTIATLYARDNTVPDYLYDSSDYLFAYCENLVEISVDENNEYFSSKDGVFYNKDKSRLIRYPAKKTGTDFIVPETVSVICSNSFIDCNELENVTISVGVTRIENYAFNEFLDLESITILHPFCSIDYYEYGALGNPMVIYGYPGSTAERFAENNDCEFVSLCNHNPEITIVDATCTTDGYASFICDICGSFEIVNGEAFGHYDFDSDDFCDSCGAPMFYFINAGETITVDASGSIPTYIKFVPGETGVYRFYSQSEDDTLAAVAVVTDTDWELISIDEDGNGGFLIECELVAGNTYIFMCMYEKETMSGSFDVTLEKKKHAHESEAFVTGAYDADSDDICDICGEPLFCYINEGETITVDISWPGVAYVKFTPEETGTYKFYSLNSDYGIGSVYNLNWDLIASDGDGTGDFMIECELVAGNTYILCCVYASVAMAGSYDVTVEKIGSTVHDYVAVVTPPTCTEQGYTTYTCACGESYVGDYTDATGHDTEHVVIPSTCTVAGMEYDICLVCDEALNSSVLPLAEHTKEITAGKTATCTETGLTDGEKCSVCGTVIKEQEAIPATGHTFGEWTETKAPSYIEPGELTRECACGEKETQETGKITADNTITDTATNVMVGYTDDTFEGAPEVSAVKQFDGDSYQLLNQVKGDFRNILFDISISVGGEKIQPDGLVLVGIPLPEGFNAEETVVYFVRNDGTGLDKMNSYYEDGYIWFETSHFSPYALVDESETVEKYVLGDANGDGKVTAADARIVLRTSAKLETLEGNLFLAADVNKDGKITAADARKILRVSAKIDTF